MFCSFILFGNVFGCKFMRDKCINFDPPNVIIQDIENNFIKYYKSSHNEIGHILKVKDIDDKFKTHHFYLDFDKNDCLIVYEGYMYNED